MNSPLALWRRNAGFTQEDLAKLAGVSQAHVSEVECCTTPLCQHLEDLLRRIAERGSSDSALEAANVADRHAAFIRQQQGENDEGATQVDHEHR